MAAVLLWPAILAAIGSLGIVEATTYLVAEGRERAGNVTATALAAAAVQSLLLVLIGAAVIPIVFRGSDQEARHAAFLCLASIPLGLIPLCLMATLSGLQRFAWYSMLRALPYAGATGGIVGLVLAGRLTVWTATSVYLVANAVTGIVAALILHSAKLGRSRFDLRVARRLFGFGIRSHTSAVSSSLNERLDQLLISLFLAPSRLGLYVVAVTLTSATTLVGSSVALVALPLVAGRPDEERHRVARRMLWLTIGAATGLSIVIGVIAPTLIRLFFGNDFTGATTSSRVLLAAAIFLSANRVLGSVLKAMGRPLSAGTAELLGVAVTLALLAALLPALGILGAAVASVLAYCVSFAWLLRRTAQAFGVRPLDFTIGRRGPAPSSGTPGLGAVKL